MSEEKKINVKINAKHGGKEFNNYFRFIGRVKPFKKKEGDDWVDQPYFVQTTTSTNKPRRVLQFILETAKDNELKIENNGMERDFAYLYSSVAKKSYRIDWAVRKDKSKYPDETYHLLLPEWDLTEELSPKLSDDVWVEVKGKYEFDVIPATENSAEVKLVKRMVTEINHIENGQEIRIGQEKFNYITDFNSPDFREVNTYRMQIGIKSTYQDEKTKNTKINGVYLAYGKERSVPRDVELTVYYAEAEEGKISLSDAFARLNHLDFLEVQGVDNNRGEFSWVEIEDVTTDSNPFADVSSEGKTARMEKVVTGTRKGLEVLSYVQGSYIKELLTEDEITPVIQTQAPNSNSTLSISDEDLPF